MTYDKAYERAMEVKNRFGRMPTWEEFERFLGDDLDAVVDGLGVASSKQISIEIIHETRRRAGLPENLIDDSVHPYRSPMNIPEKRQLGRDAARDYYLRKALREGVTN